MATHDEVVAFLSGADVVGPGVPRIYKTHIALVFVAGSRALKIKRPVKLAFVDFSTLALRHSACDREIAVNRDNAPEIYRGVVAITREPDRSLAIGGRGAPVEYAVEMRAFADEDLLSNRAAKGPLDAALMRQTADAIHAMHQLSERAFGVDLTDKMRAIIAEVAGMCRGQPDVLNVAEVNAWEKEARTAVAGNEALLRTRADLGAVRRCHGDLHLANIVVWNGVATLFDALEFSEEMARVDTLYDLAFLLMDLVHHRQRAAANTVLNRYLWRSGGKAGDTADLDGLRLMPLYLSCRAGIRAMVAATRTTDADPQSDAYERGCQQARGYLDEARAALAPPAPRLIAVGGLSGSGKSTLAAALAPGVGLPLGALHIRTDMERKAMMGVEPTDRLPPEYYTLDTARQVYERVLRRARAGLGAGQCVIVDAVFAAGDERAHAAQLARDLGVAFDGLWLDADPDILRHRVGQRQGDASDATLAVVERQLGYDLGDLNWVRVPAGGTPETTLAAAHSALELAAAGL